MKLAPVYVPAKNDEAPEPIIIPVGGRRYDHEAEEWVDETIDVEFRPHTALGAQLDLILDGTASAVFAYLRQSLTSAGEKAWETIETDPDLEVNAETLAQVCIVLARAWIYATYKATDPGMGFVIGPLASAGPDGGMVSTSLQLHLSLD